LRGWCLDRWRQSVCGHGSDCLDEFVERRRKPEMTISGIDAEFVVPAPQVLNEPMPPNNHGRGCGWSSVHASGAASL